MAPEVPNNGLPRHGGLPDHAPPLRHGGVFFKQVVGAPGEVDTPSGLLFPRVVHQETVYGKSITRETFSIGLPLDLGFRVGHDPLEGCLPSRKFGFGHKRVERADHALQGLNPPAAVGSFQNSSWDKNSLWVFCSAAAVLRLSW